MSSRIGFSLTKIRSHSLDLLAPLWLIFTATLTRLAFFGYPASVVFDETYAGKFLNYNWHGIFFFDVHPPLGKLLFLFTAKIVGADPTNINFDTIGNVLPSTTLLLRLLPIICGILLPIVVYLILRLLKVSRFASFAVGFLIVIENSLIVQSRFMLNDSMMVLFGFIAILMYLLYRRSLDIQMKVKEVQYSKRLWNLFFILSAIFASASFGVKWTGLLFTFFIIFLEITRLFSIQDKIISKVKRFYLSINFFKKIIRFVFFYFLIGGILYIAFFAISFSILTKSGPGDAYMSTEFNKTLTGSPANNSRLPARGFIGKFFELNIVMFEMNNTLTKPHQYSSKWYTWPIMTRPIFYWQGDKDAGVPNKDSPGERYIYLLGNPFIYWFGTFSILALVFLSIFKRRIFMAENMGFLALFVLSGFAINFIPFKMIGRIMFLYHYEPALIFSIMAIVLFTQIFGSVKFKKYFLIITLLIATIFFIFFSPLTYGLHLDSKGLSSRMWLSTWR